MKCGSVFGAITLRTVIKDRYFPKHNPLRRKHQRVLLHFHGYSDNISVVHKNKWETMTFNVFEMGTEEAVHHAFQVLSAGGVVIEPIGAVPWSKCCATVIDRYGVCWWISI